MFPREFRIGSVTSRLLGDLSDIATVDAKVIELAVRQAHQLAAGLAILAPVSVGSEDVRSHGHFPSDNRTVGEAAVVVCVSAALVDLNIGDASQNEHCEKSHGCAAHDAKQHAIVIIYCAAALPKEAAFATMQASRCGSFL